MLIFKNSVQNPFKSISCRFKMNFARECGFNNTVKSQILRAQYQIDFSDFLFGYGWHTPEKRAKYIFKFWRAALTIKLLIGVDSKINFQNTLHMCEFLLDYAKRNFNFNLVTTFIYIFWCHSINFITPSNEECSQEWI